MTAMEVDTAGVDAGQKQKVGAVDDAKKNIRWVEKYRPTKLADVAAHKDIIDTIGRLTSQDRLPHLLLYGPPGTGKTSTILAVAKELYGPQFSQMTLELNASAGTSPDRSRHFKKQTHDTTSPQPNSRFPVPPLAQIAASPSRGTRSARSPPPCASAPTPGSSSSSSTSATP